MSDFADDWMIGKKFRFVCCPKDFSGDGVKATARSDNDSGRHNNGINNNKNIYTYLNLFASVCQWRANSSALSCFQIKICKKCCFSEI